ncbi:MAG: peptidase, partial [Longimicrobiales bacterium]
ILEQYEFPFTRVFAQELDAGNLNQKYDALVFVGGGIPAASTSGRGGGAGQQQQPADIPAEYQSHLGRVTAGTTLPRLEQFVRAGGTVIAIGESATNLAAFLKLPLEDHLVENGSPLPRTRFYTPGSLLAARVNTTHPVALGMSEITNVFFDDSPVFKLGANAAAAGVTPIAWFDGKAPLRSGWSWGQQYLDQGVVAAEAKVGRGRVLLFGPEILKRAQPHGTFKFLFNALR